MVKQIILDDTTIQVEHYSEENVNGLTKITINFKVTSEEYHDIAVLLYRETFDVKVPERGMSFKGSIHQYSTSVTNLYQKGQVADYKVTLLEKKPVKE
ncbi:MAG: DUF3219 family protein [Heyndrickxia sp.]